MPTYQYACTSCGEQLEVVQSFTDDALTQCPACETGRLRKLFGNVGVVFKGSGFYRTDSRSGSGSSGSGSSGSGSSGSGSGSGSSGSGGSGSGSTKAGTSDAGGGSGNGGSTSGSTAAKGAGTTSSKGSAA